MSEQQAEPTSGETGSVSAGPAVSSSSDAASQPAAQQTPKAVAEVESPDLVPAQGDAPKEDAAKVEAPKVEAPKVEAPKPKLIPPRPTRRARRARS